MANLEGPISIVNAYLSAKKIVDERRQQEEDNQFRQEKFLQDQKEFDAEQKRLFSQMDNENKFKQAYLSLAQGADTRAQNSDARAQTKADTEQIEAAIKGFVPGATSTSVGEADAAFKQPALDAKTIAEINQAGEIAKITRETQKQQSALTFANQEKMADIRAKSAKDLAIENNKRAISLADLNHRYRLDELKEKKDSDDTETINTALDDALYGIYNTDSPRLLKLPTSTATKIHNQARSNGVLILTPKQIEQAQALASFKQFYIEAKALAEQVKTNPKTSFIPTSGASNMKNQLESKLAKLAEVFGEKGMKSKADVEAQKANVPDSGIRQSDNPRRLKNLKSYYDSTLKAIFPNLSLKQQHALSETMGIMLPGDDPEVQ